MPGAASAPPRRSRSRACRRTPSSAPRRARPAGAACRRASPAATAARSSTWRGVSGEPMYQFTLARSFGGVVPCDLLGDRVDELDAVRVERVGRARGRVDDELPGRVERQRRRDLERLTVGPRGRVRVDRRVVEVEEQLARPLRRVGFETSNFQIVPSASETKIFVVSVPTSLGKTSGVPVIGESSGVSMMRLGVEQRVVRVVRRHVGVAREHPQDLARVEAHDRERPPVDRVGGA